MSDATVADHCDGVSARAPASGLFLVFQRVSSDFGFALVPGAKSGAFRILPALRAFVRSLMLTVALLSLFSPLLGRAHADVTTEKWAKPWQITQVSAPPHYSPDVVRVAVLPFTTPGDDEALGTSLMNKLTAAIAQEGFLETMSRADIESVLAEQRFQGSGFADPETIREVGKLLGVDTLIVGSASRIESETASHEEEVVDYYKKVQKSKQVWNKEKQKHETKYFTEKVPVYKKVRVVEQWSHASLEVKLIDVETGRVVYAGTGSGDFKNRNFDNKGTTYPEGTIEDWAVKTAIEELTRQITPYSETLTTYLMCYAADFINADFAHGWKLAVEGDLEGALPMLEKAYRPDEVKGERERYILWNEIVVLAALERYERFFEVLEEYERKYRDSLESGERGHAARIRAFIERSLGRLHGAPKSAVLLQVVAIDGAEYYLAQNASISVSVGQVLIVFKVRTIMNELSGEVIATREVEVAQLVVVEVTSDYVLCRLLDGEVAVGDRVRVA